MDFDCFKCDFVIFGIGNEYKDVYGDSYKLKSDFSGWLHEERMKLGDLGLENRPKTRVCL